MTQAPMREAMSHPSSIPVRTSRAAGFAAGVAVTLAVQPFVGNKAFKPIYGPKIEKAANRIDDLKHPVVHDLVLAFGQGATAAPPATERAENRIKVALHISTAAKSPDVNVPAMYPAEPSAGVRSASMPAVRRP
jgi:hypothetical protein